jgi:hypothetical protein
MKSVFKSGERIERKILKVVEEHDKDLYNEICDDGGIGLNKEQWARVGKLLARHSQTFYNHIKSTINAVVSRLQSEDRLTELLLTKITRISKEMLDEKIGGGEDWYISAEDALRLGICEEII